MKGRGLGAKGRPPSKRAEVTPAVDSFPTDGCGRPESAAGQAKIPQEAGKGESDAHTTEEVSIYENQGELRPGQPWSLLPSLILHHGAPPPPSTLPGKDRSLRGHCLVAIDRSYPWVRGDQLPCPPMLCFNIGYEPWTYEQPGGWRGAAVNFLGYPANSEQRGEDACGRKRQA